MRIEFIKKGDIVTYRTGGINIVNKPNKYYEWYKKNFKHKKFGKWADIVKIQRYVKFLCFYRLVTIYERVEND